MSQKLLIDAFFPSETRVVVTDGKQLQDFDYEQSHRVPIKGNIYLAKVTRVEPSLQAAFVDYGSSRHGFLSFNDIHPDYFRIPVGDMRHDEEEEDDSHDDSQNIEDDIESVQEDESHEDSVREARRRHNRLKRTYKIQEVIKRGQVILVQAVKEERGTKGAAMTSYISLAGRYCVLMPNTDRGSGISRKISDGKDRSRLKEAVRELSLPEGMGLIVRTAGAGQNKAEIRRDFSYISDTWDKVRELTMESTAPKMVYEEGNLLKRAIRDLYNKNVDNIIVDGKEAYNSCKNLMKSLMPSHVKKITLHKGDTPLFIEHGVEEQLKSISDMEVPLKSGGFLILNQTEALVAIDVNSGKAIRERHIEKTALATNLEAVEEIARQLKLRDMAGLIVIDLITMDDRRNNKTVENHFRKSLRSDRARIQVGHISIFGLLELSRQRIRPSFLESIHERCPMCEGGGFVQSNEFIAQSLMRRLEIEASNKVRYIKVEVSASLANYLLNHKCANIQHLKETYGLEIEVIISPNLHNGFLLPSDEDKAEASESQKDNKPNRFSKHKHNKKKETSHEDQPSHEKDNVKEAEAEDESEADTEDNPPKKKSRSKKSVGKKAKGKSKKASAKKPTHDESPDESPNENPEASPNETPGENGEPNEPADLTDE